MSKTLTASRTMLGLHWLIELWGCSPSLLGDVAQVESILLGAARRANTTVVDSLFHNFTPHGVSGFVIISESHLAIHTWPDHSYAAVDLFTCGHREKMQMAYDHIVAEFRPKSHVKNEIIRGLSNKNG